MCVCVYVFFQIYTGILAKLASAVAHFYAQIGTSLSGPHAGEKIAKHFKVPFYVLFVYYSYVY